MHFLIMETKKQCNAPMDNTLIVLVPFFYRQSVEINCIRAKWRLC